ncbi:dipeptidase PepV [Bacillus marinisedimentorum]|uniref:dipeptidase PepV n=1 Tax=Bacillus marinisedimentorum TaxID=1821260 RepID=UPI0008732511|nr:dipeptidase PepV [Bacillus marinisedimentorum]
MSHINWQEEAEKRKDEIIETAQRYLRIKSVLDENGSQPGAPFGSGIAEALGFMLEMGEKDGFQTKNLDGYAGHIEYGQGELLIGILCHVDVVPEGDGWTSGPYSAEIRDGKIFARGAMDDKGPTIAAYFGLKMVKELGLPLSKRARIILGTDEESDWRGVEHYFEQEEMPDMGFAPDADFPIIYAEKGIADFELVQNASLDTENAAFILEQFHSGHRLNMVPDFAEAVIYTEMKVQVLQKQLDQYLKEYKVEGTYEDLGGQQMKIRLEGVSAHGMEPDNGTNAGLLLANFLSNLDLDEKSAQYIEFINQYLYDDSRGNRFGVAAANDELGDLTINAGLFRYSKAEGGTLGLNLRYPAGVEIKETKKQIEGEAAKFSFRMKGFDDTPPHHVDKSHPLIGTLSRVYEEQTGDEAELVAIGGGTYARSLQAGVAFGPLFPGRPDVAHQKDEHIFIDDLIKAAAIYGQAIYELAR